MGKNFPVVIDAFGIDGDHNTLGAEALRGFADKGWVADGGRVNANLVGAGIEHGADIGDGTNATADRQRDKDLPGDGTHRLDHGTATFVGGGDVEHGDFVGTLLVIAFGDLDRVPGVADIKEVDTLNDSAPIDIQAWNNSFG